MTKPGILFQHFYYPTPNFPAERSWWRQATAQLAELARLGVWGVWHPVPVKGGSGRDSMGYDPYDYYDLGSKEQRGTISTHFGTRDDYLRYIATAHAHGLSVVADVVLNHCSGADQAQLSPVQERLGWDDIPDDSKVPADHLPPGYNPSRDNLRAWSGFNPTGVSGRRGTGRFPRDSRHFHPTALHPERNTPYHHPDFGSDYCFEADDRYVAQSFLAWSEWFRRQTGVDGFRLDAVKLMEPEFLREFSAATPSDFYQVGELWDTNPQLLADFQQRTGNRMKLFDFGLFYGLKDMMVQPSFDMRTLLTRRFADRERAVTFVSNHDVDRFDPIPTDRRALPYAILLAMSGQPSLFYHDYFDQDGVKPLGKTLRPLAELHNTWAWGTERVLLATPEALALERESGLIAVFMRPGGPQTVVVPTRWKKTSLVSLPSGSAASLVNASLTTDPHGNLTLTFSASGAQGAWAFFAPPRALPRRLAPPQGRSTTQVFEFDDDLDTGRLGDTQRRVSVTAAGGSTLEARLSGTYGVGSTLVELRDDQNRGAAVAVATRGKTVVLRTRIPRDGTYHFLIRAPGNPTNAFLSVTYRAPQSR